MQVRVGCEFVYQAAYQSPMVFLIRPREHDVHDLIEETWTLAPDLPLHAYTDSFGNRAWRLTAPAGALRLRYDAVASVDPAPEPVLAGLPGTLVEQLPDDVLGYTLPSRHCQSDLFSDEAWALFGSTPNGGARVQAICNWIHANIMYGAGSLSTTSGYEAYQQRRGVCRDIAHIAVSFCRALNIPARYVCGYLPDIGVPLDPTPMDFHAWFEAYLDGAWRTFDARHNRPRTGRVVIARGRDAVDTALTTIYGSAKLVSMRVWADEIKQPAPHAQPLQTTEVHG